MFAKGFAFKYVDSISSNVGHVLYILYFYHFNIKSILVNKNKDILQICMRERMENKPSSMDV